MLEPSRPRFCTVEDIRCVTFNTFTYVCDSNITISYLFMATSAKQFQISYVSLRHLCTLSSYDGGLPTMKGTWSKMIIAITLFEATMASCRCTQIEQLCNLSKNSVGAKKSTSSFRNVLLQVTTERRRIFRG